MWFASAEVFLCRVMMKPRLAAGAAKIIDGVARALARFPLAVLSALVTLGVLLVVVEMKGDAEWPWQRVALAVALGVPLGVFIVIAGESRGWVRSRIWLLQALGSILLAGYWATLPAEDGGVPDSVWVRTVVIALALHLGVASGARHGSQRAFWSFNWVLFSRFWLGVLYAVVFFAGLALAMSSAAQLFEFELESDRYMQLWLLVTVGFHPLFLLAGVPRTAAGEQAELEPSRGLRIFAGGVLLPLAVVYLGILYPYAIKIAVVHRWPEGWVAAPVLGLAVVGLLAVLLLAGTGLRWAEIFTRWFARLLVPMAGLLAFAVLERVNDYGLTESRYAGLVLAGWLVVIGVYFGTGEVARRSLRLIPVSLCILCAVAAAGPVGLFAVAERSQLARLDRLLTSHGLLEAGVMHPKPQVLSGEDYTSLRSTMDYLQRRHRSAGMHARLALWLKTEPAKRTDRWGFGEEVCQWLKVTGGDRSNNEHFQLLATNLTTDGFGSAAYIEMRSWSKESPEADGVKLRISSDRKAVEMEMGDRWEEVAAINAGLRDHVFVAGKVKNMGQGTITVDVALSSGEKRRLVILAAEGQGWLLPEAAIELERVNVLVLVP
jgi:hypothetical protein